MRELIERLEALVEGSSNLRSLAKAIDSKAPLFVRRLQTP